MNQNSVNRDNVTDDALLILRHLRDNGVEGKSNRLAEVKSALQKSVSLDFDSYFFFLRKFNYIAMDREAQLSVTEDGQRLIEGNEMDKFSEDVEEFFADQLNNTDHGIRAEPDISMDESLDEESRVPSMSPIKSRKVKEDLEPFDSPPSFEASAPSSSGGTGKGTDVDQRYTRFDTLGSGPLGTVYKGRQNALGLDVCLKELKDIFGYFSFLQRGDVLKRLKRELCAQAQVRHPGVVAILDQNTDVSRPYFVMELAQSSLKEKLESGSGKGIPIPQAIRYFIQMAYALRASHAIGLTHHNLKPENILFDGYGNAKLGDYGLSRVIEVDPTKGMPQVFVGTGSMRYMAPELLSKSKPAGPSADIYSLGILLYEMLTGSIPGRRSALPSEVNNEAPSKLDLIFDKMAQDKPESRYPDFDAMLSDFYSSFSDGEYLTQGDLILWSGQKEKAIDPKA